MANKNTEEYKQFKKAATEQFKGSNEKQKMDALIGALYDSFKEKGDKILLEKENATLKQTIDSITLENDSLKEKNIKSKTKIQDLLQLNSEIKERNRELRKENLKLRTQFAENGMEIEHQASATKVSYSSKLLNVAKEKVKNFFSPVKEKGKELKDDFVLERQKNYHNRHLKARAFLLTVKEFTLKPIGKFSKKQYNNSKKAVEAVHNKVQIDLAKQGLNKMTSSNYTMMFVTVATEKSVSKLYEKSGAKKKVEETLNSETATKIKNSWGKAVMSYQEHVATNKAKSVEINKKVEARKEAKQTITK
ncbi:Atg14 domain-containing protein [[Brevibacterium] frigoritolerans]|nr:Atg14 domain-containing protein [Peribacillus frigoritolerans]